MKIIGITTKIIVCERCNKVIERRRDPAQCISCGRYIYILTFKDEGYVY